METLRVRVPATSANLGSGFDCIGLALRMFNWIIAKKAPGVALKIQVKGEGEEEIPRDERNLVWRAFVKVYEMAGEEMPGLEIRLENRIPVCSGLGSSASGIAGGLVLANEFLGGRFSKEELIAVGMGIEGHVDNLAAAIMGGLTVACIEEQWAVSSAQCAGRVYCQRYEVWEGYKAIVCVPKLEVETAASRRRLPKKISLADAVYNMGHALILMAGLTEGEGEKVRVGMRDRLHQDTRLELIPGAEEAMEAALEEGAEGACLSGSGPTLLAIATKGTRKIANAMEEGFASAGVEARARVVGIDVEGARAEKQ